MTDKTKKEEKPTYLHEGEGFVDITLSRPMDVDGAKVTKIRLREPTVDDQLAMEESKGSDAKKEVNLLASLCMVSPADIGKLPLRDYKRLQVGLQTFID